MAKTATKRPITTSREAWKLTDLRSNSNSLSLLISRSNPPQISQIASFLNFPLKKAPWSVAGDQNRHQLRRLPSLRLPLSSTTSPTSKPLSPTPETLTLTPPLSFSPPQRTPPPPPAPPSAAVPSLPQSLNRRPFADSKPLSLSSPNRLERPRLVKQKL